MKKRRSIKDPRGESLLFQRRALAGFVLIVLSLCLLVSRFVFLQVMRHDEFVTRSQANRVKPRAIPPARGLIYDRNGVLLADNVPAFRLEVVPEQVKDMPALLTALGKVVPLGQDDLDAFRKQLTQSRRFDSVPLKMHLTEDEIDRFAVNRWRFPGVDVVPYLTRRYPFGELLAHVVGYVGRIDASDVERLDPKRYQGTSHVGRSGIERSYEDVLHGTPGYELLEVNADGRTQRVLETHPPIPGKNLYLSIDVRLQRAAENAFAGRPGASVTIDPRNGQVLAMVSVPTFDPNLFVNGISQADYSALTNDPDKPLYNRALRGVYPPGSTVKAVSCAGRARIRRAPARGHRVVDGPVLPARPEALLSRRHPRRRRHGEHGARDREVDQHLFLQAGAGSRHRPVERVDEPLRLRQQDRHRPGRRVRRHPALARVESGAQQVRLVPRRNRHRRHRPGLLGGDSAAARSCHCYVRRAWRALRAATGDGHGGGGG